MLVEFGSVVDAVRCAADIQRNMAETNAHLSSDKRIEFRVGINVGYIIISDNGDVFGDSVNVAARLEQVVDPGGICVSGRVQEDVEGKLDVLFEDNGEQQLKNIAKPVRVYRVRLESGTQRAVPAPVATNRPSIARFAFPEPKRRPVAGIFR
jgi:adenylate cyclase